MIGSMNRVILFVEDVSKCTAFYRDVLGLQQTGYADEGWVPFDAGGCLLTLHKATSGKRPSKGTRSVQIVFKVSDVAAARESLTAKGVDMGKLCDVDGEFAFCDGADPEGNLFQISSRGISLWEDTHGIKDRPDTYGVIRAHHRATPTIGGCVSKVDAAPTDATWRHGRRLVGQGHHGALGRVGADVPRLVCGWAAR
jgi:catechol 2,3-dioxygenase-like lactoylglutathione lyase family enzyme